MKAPIKEALGVDLEVVSRDLNVKEAESLKAFIQANRTKGRPKAKTALRRRVQRNKVKV
jgi:hypothetical protein